MYSTPGEFLSDTQDVNVAPKVNPAKAIIFIVFKLLFMTAYLIFL